MLDKETEFKHAVVTLAQVIYENTGFVSNVGENIIKFMYKWFNPNGFNSYSALSEFAQHNEDCRYECYCCGQCQNTATEDDEPNVNDEYIKNIIMAFSSNSHENKEDDLWGREFDE